DHREDVGIVLAVRRDWTRLDLDLVAVGVREERTDRAIDQSGGENFLGGRPAFTLDEATGELSRGIDLFSVVDREREEVETLAAGAGNGRDESHCVADPDDDRAGSLLGEPAGLNSEPFVTDHTFDGDRLPRCERRG